MRASGRGRPSTWLEVAAPSKIKAHVICLLSLSLCQFVEQDVKGITEMSTIWKDNEKETTRNRNEKDIERTWKKELQGQPTKSEGGSVWTARYPDL